MLVPDISAQLKLKSVHPWLSKMHPAKILIRLRESWAHMYEGTFSDVATHILLQRCCFHVLWIPCSIKNLATGPNCLTFALDNDSPESEISVTFVS